VATPGFPFISGAERAFAAQRTLPTDQHDHTDESATLHHRRIGEW
jgi:hypothetical protein